MKKLTLTLQHIRRAPYQSLAAIIMTTVTFLIVSIFTLAAIGTHTLLTYFESRPQVTAFFLDSTTSDQLNSLQSEIENSFSTDSIIYIGKEEALTIYQDQNADNPLLLEMVTADILPASLEVSAKSVTDLEGIAQIMEGAEYVEEVIYQKDIIDTIKVWVNGVRWGGIALSGLLLFASLTTIIIILGLTFTARKLEINTLSLLGASPWYIRGPFVIEGVIYSVLGAFLGWGLSYLTLLYLTPNLVEFLQGITILPVPYWVMLVVLAGELLLGLILGSFASLIATRRYGR